LNISSPTATLKNVGIPFYAIYFFARTLQETWLRRDQQVSILKGSLASPPRRTESYGQDARLPMQAECHS